MTDKLSAEGIKKYLNLGDIFDISVFECVTSTNSLAKELAQSGEKQGGVIIAESQTAGRGRLGRSFRSPENSGLYMSILLRPELKAENAVFITAAAAVAVSGAVEHLSGKATAIKWVNDILCGGKKVCGILTEGGIIPENGYLNWAVLGIGVNVYEPEDGFADDIKDIAGAVFEKNQPDIKNRLAAEILSRFWKLYGEIENRTFFDDYKKRMITIGKRVTVIKGDTQTDAYCLDLDGDCRLLVEYADDKREYIASGEVSVRPESLSDKM